MNTGSSTPSETESTTIQLPVMISRELKLPAALLRGINLLYFRIIEDKRRGIFYL
jgi:hypothetical protein